MLYVDYNFHIGDNMIMFDEELKLCSQDNQNNWGNLPSTWREGDTFKLITGANGRVTLLKCKE